MESENRDSSYETSTRSATVIQRNRSSRKMSWLGYLISTRCGRWCRGTGRGDDWKAVSPQERLRCTLMMMMTSRISSSRFIGVTTSCPTCRTTEPYAGQTSAIVLTIWRKASTAIFLVLQESEVLMVCEIGRKERKATVELPSASLLEAASAWSTSVVPGTPLFR